MIEEDYVSFEIAKLLKEKGFNEECRAFWKDWDGQIMLCHCSSNHVFEWCHNSMLEEYYNNNEETNIAAPTLQVAMKWLREKYNYQIIATPEYGDVEYMPGQWQEEFLGWKYTIIPFNGNKSIMHPSVYSITAESAYEAAIKYCLENLI